MFISLYNIEPHWRSSYITVLHTKNTAYVYICIVVTHTKSTRHYSNMSCHTFTGKEKENALHVVYDYDYNTYNRRWSGRHIILGKSSLMINAITIRGTGASDWACTWAWYCGWGELTSWMVLGFLGSGGGFLRTARVSTPPRGFGLCY